MSTFLYGLALSSLAMPGLAFSVAPTMTTFTSNVQQRFYSSHDSNQSFMC